MTLEEILGTEMEDRYWNKIYQQKWKLILYLAKNKETRNMWKIWYCNWQQCLIVRRWERHILYKINGWWFNYELLSKLPWNTLVVVDKEKSDLSYKLTVDEILEQWQFLHFLTVWFEKQIFVPIRNFQVFIRNKREKWK